MVFPDGQSRSVIAGSWRRAEMCGVDPSLPLESSGIEEFDQQSRLIMAAGPVLDEMAAALEGTRFGVALADQEARLIDLRMCDRALRSRLEQLGVVHGRVFGEEHIGTNSIATALEVGRGVAVRGEEHYIEALKHFSCYGHPIYHPATRRLEGVLDITCLAVDDNPLLAPFLIRSVRQIEERLLAGARVAEQRMLSAFQDAVARHRDRPVVALGGEIFLANPAAVELLDAADHAVLRDLAVDAIPAPSSRRFRLSSGQEAIVSVCGLADGALFTFDSVRDHSLIRTSRVPASVVVHGEPGSGRTYAVRELIGDGEGVVWLDASDLPMLGARGWLSRLDGSLAIAEAVVIEAVHLLPEPVARLVARSLRTWPTRVVLTSTSVDELNGEHAGLVAHCVERAKLAPLRQRRDEIPALVQSMLAEMGAPRELRFTPGALEALAGQPWPGNLRELSMVVRQVMNNRKVGDVAVYDLPEAYRARARSRALTPMEQAERDAVSEALRLTGGNKKDAAQRLGISRTTLYRAIRSYGIIPPRSEDHPRP